MFLEIFALIVKGQGPLRICEIVFSGFCWNIYFFFSRIFCNWEISSILWRIFCKFKSGGYNATFYGKMKHPFKFTIWKHLGVSLVTGKRIKGNYKSGIKSHYLFCNHSSDFVFTLDIPVTINILFEMMKILHENMLNAIYLYWFHNDTRT